MRPPRHLSASSRAWWSSVAATYTLDAHHYRLLTLCCEAFDRGVEARERVLKDGAFFVNRDGEPRVHPAVLVETSSRIAFARLLRELDLDVEPPKSPSRTPGRY